MAIISFLMMGKRKRKEKPTTSVTVVYRLPFGEGSRAVRERLI